MILVLKLRDSYDFPQNLNFIQLIQKLPQYTQFILTRCTKNLKISNAYTFFKNYKDILEVLPLNNIFILFSILWDYKFSTDFNKKKEKRRIIIIKIENKNSTVVNYQKMTLIQQLDKICFHERCYTYKWI